MARHDAGAPLNMGEGLDASFLCSPGSGWGFDFLELPSGAAADPALAPFLQPASDDGGAQVLRLKGVATAME